MKTINEKKLSQKQIYLIGTMLYKFQDFYEIHSKKLESYEIEFAGIIFKVWKQNLEAIYEIINCIEKAL